MSDNKLTRSDYLNKNIGTFQESMNINGIRYKKVEDLRYGTNPHQPAAYYIPISQENIIGDMKVLKTGKNGLSQTNLEDISYALNIVKFFDSPACAVMKHVNPSGAAVARGNDSLRDVYIKARDCDPRAAFGSVVAFNSEVDVDTASEIMKSFVECVVSIGFTPEALEIFNGNSVSKINKSIRLIECKNISSLPKYYGDSQDKHRTIKILADGSAVVAEPLMTSLRSVADLKKASSQSKTCGAQISHVDTSAEQLDDLLSAWYVNINVRSNGVVIMKNGQTLSVGTGEQDRVGVVEQAILKFKQKYEGHESLQAAVMSSDGFFPFADAVEVAAKEGIKAIISPAGSLKDAEVIKRANELGIALYHAPERIFSHH